MIIRGTINRAPVYLPVKIAWSPSQQVCIYIYRVTLSCSVALKYWSMRFHAAQKFEGLKMFIFQFNIPDIGDEQNFNWSSK